MRVLVRYSIVVGWSILFFGGTADAQEKGEHQGSGGAATQAVGGGECAEECGPPAYAIDVLNGGSINVPYNSSGVVSFSVLSTGTVGWTYTFTCSKTGGVTCGLVTPSSRFMAGGGDDAVVQVAYSVGTTPGTLRLTANGPVSDMGSVSITPLPQGPPQVAIRNRNDDNWDRSQCLVTGAGPGASVCGDLLVAHGMPGYSTMGRERSLTLVYSSHQAAPTPVVVAAVTTPAGYAAPSVVKARLNVQASGFLYGPVGSGKFSGWAAGTRQIAVKSDVALPTGVYRYMLAVTYEYPSGSYESWVFGVLSVVDRDDGFGEGWSLAGVERLYFNQPNPSAGGTGILWVGGEGSTKLYTLVPGSSNRWVAPPGAFRDTIVQSGGTYTRTLRHGVEVIFDTLGLHQRTVNRVGQTSRFWHSTGAPYFYPRLDSVEVPSGSGAPQRYRIQRSGSTVTLKDPANRTLTGLLTGGNLTRLTDPDGLYAEFGYDGNRRMISYQDRRGFTSTFYYSYFPRLRSVLVPDGPTGATTAVTTFEPWDMKGFAFDTTGSFPAVDTAQVYTTIKGPRVGVADDALFWVDRWGAPTKIQDPLGHVTTIDRDDVATPARVTRVAYPNGRVVHMNWNARANLTSVVDDPPDLDPATTTYTYGTLNPDAPSAVTDPDGVTSTYGYLGSPTALRGMLGTATAPNGHVTQLKYIESGPLVGQVDTVVELNIKGWNEALQQQTTGVNAATAVFYNALGNVDSVTTPLGRRTKYARDAVQRVIEVTDPGDHVMEYQFDAMNRVTHSIQYADDLFIPQLTTRFWYTDGLLDSIVDPRQVPRGYRYDARGRVLAEVDDYEKADSTFYDRAGLVDSIRTRRGHTIRFKYDAAGQVLEKAWTADYAYLADSVTFTYDNLGQMLTATTHNSGLSDNRSVVRTYYGNGLLKTEVQGVSFLTNTYGYTAAGRRDWYVVGTPGSQSLSDSIDYTYSGTTGELNTIGVRWRGQPPVFHTVSFGWDALGRRESVSYPNGAAVTTAYDADGHRRLVCGTHPGSSAAGTLNDPHAFRFAQLTTSLDQDGLPLEIGPGTAPTHNCQPGGRFAYEIEDSHTFNSRHHLTSNDYWHYQYDGSGNMAKRTSALIPEKVVTFSMEPQHNRLATYVQTYGGSLVSYDTVAYNADGSRSGERHCRQPSGSCAIDHSYHYDPLGRLTSLTDEGVFIVCTNDPLGRMHGACRNPGGVGQAFFLGYDGDNAVRTRENSDLDAWTFVHGPGIDDPILGYYHGNGVSPIKKVVYFVTDGVGRFIAVGDTNGTDASDDDWYINTGGWLHGAAGESLSYDASRPDGLVDSLGFFRNRIYDQRTGRWTQEDPIGVGGGLNLYAFNSNNPVAYSDPFGLCGTPPDSIQIEVTVVCPPGDPNWYGKRKVWAHRASQSEINQLVSAAGKLKGGSKTFQVSGPLGINTSYRQLGSTGAVYVFPNTSSDGLTVATGAQTTPTYQAWKADLWSHIVAGTLSQAVGNVGITACAAVGHEGVHLLQQQGLGLGTGGTTRQRETEARLLNSSWTC